MKIVDPAPANLPAAVQEVVQNGLVGIEGSTTPATKFQRQVVQALKKQQPPVSVREGYVDYKDGVTSRGYLYVVYNPKLPQYDTLDKVKAVVAAFDQANPI